MAYRTDVRRCRSCNAVGVELQCERCVTAARAKVAHVVEAREQRGALMFQEPPSTCLDDALRYALEYRRPELPPGVCCIVASGGYACDCHAREERARQLTRENEALRAKKAAIKPGDEVTKNGHAGWYFVRDHGGMAHVSVFDDVERSDSDWIAVDWSRIEPIAKWEPKVGELAELRNTGARAVRDVCA